MKHLFLLLMVILSALPALGDDQADALNCLPQPYRGQVERQLALAGKNRANLLAAVRAARPDEREALAVLLANMPPRDLAAVGKDFLLTNVEYACKARAEMPWGKTIGDELFFREVLPYASVNERRDDWRKDFYQRFAALARRCRTPGEAALLLNKEVFRQLKVNYHPTKRPKPDQSPYESAEAGYASCTGLSILLIDACRAVCIPARMAGIVSWPESGGNHTWTEVWDRQWHVLGALDGNQLDQAWFMSRAAKADAKRREHRIYAVSFFPTDDWFPMVWAWGSRDVPAWNVTGFYTSRRHVTFRIADHQGGPAAWRLSVRQGGQLVAEDLVAGSAAFVLAGGSDYDVEVRAADGLHRLKRQVRLGDGENQVIDLPVPVQ